MNKYSQEIQFFYCDVFKFRSQYFAAVQNLVVVFDSIFSSNFKELGSIEK